MRLGQKNQLTYRWARRVHAPVPPTSKAPNRPILSVQAAPNAQASPPSCCRPATPKLCSFTSMRSQPKSLRALTLFSSSIKPSGIAPRSSRFPNNISRLQHPPRAPELNGQENIWQFMRQNWLSNRIFKSFDDIVDHCCYARNTLIEQPCKIMSLPRRDWAAVGHSN